MGVGAHPRENEMNNNITKLMRYLFIVGVVIFLVLVVFPLIIGRQGALSSLKAQEQQTNLTVSRTLVHAYWSELEHLLVDADTSRVDTSGLGQALEELQEGSIVKVNLFNREGVTVHSTDTSVIGEKEVDNANLVAALEGEISQAFEKYTLEEGGSKTIQVLSVYLPVYYHIDPELDHDTENHNAADHDSDEVIGVLELYSDVTPQLQGINRAQAGIALSTTILLLLIYGSAFFFLRRATKTLADKQQQLERYALLVEHTPSVLMEATGDGQLLFLNSSAQKHFPELRGVTGSFSHPLFAAWESVTTHLLPGTTFERELKVNDKTYLQKISYNAGSQNYDLYAHDLSQQKRSEAELLRAQRDQRALLEAVPDMVFVMSKEGTYLDFKLDKSHQVLEELVGRNVRDLSFMTPEIAESLVAKLQLATHTKQVQTLEYSLEGYFGDGRRLTYYEARFAPVDDEKVLMVVRDVSERRHQELALQHSEAQVKSLLEAIPDMVFVMSRDGTYLDVKLDKTHGLIEELVGRNVRELGFMSSDIAEGIVEKLQRASGSGETQSLEYSLEGNIAGVRRLAYYEARFTPIDKDKVLMLVRDVSQRHNDETALQTLTNEAQRQAKELLLLDNVRSALTSQLELKEFYEAIVEAVTKHLGYPCAFIYEVEGGIFKLAHQIGYATSLFTMPTSQGISGRVLRTGAAVLVPDVSQDPDHVAVQTNVLSGIYVPFYYNDVVKGVLSVETLREGGLTLTEHDLELLSSLSDMITLGITRVQLYSELKKNEERYRELIENASDIIYRIDLKGYFTYTNSVVKRLTGYDEAEIIGKHYLELVREDYRKEAQVFYIRQLKENLATTYLEFPAVAKDGGEVWIGQNVSLVKEQSQIVGMQAVARDISERKRMEEALLKQAEELSTANADLEQFAFIAAHDLQEPLRKIQAFGDRLNLKYKNVLDDTGRDYLERMRSSATRMRTLIDDLLSFARANKQQQRSLVSLETVVKGVIRDLQEPIEETGATVSVGALPTLELDPSQFRQVFQNLLSNALKFRKSEVPPVITVYSHRLTANGNWEICISDNGIGFDEQYNERIFGVFQRLHGRDQYEGTGIGLAIVRRIIEAHDGSIKVSSRPGEGTTFSITLPGVAKIATQDILEGVLA
jgi:PAS domain S-box-containing protein